VNSGTEKVSEREAKERSTPSLEQPTKEETPTISLRPFLEPSAASNVECRQRYRLRGPLITCKSPRNRRSQELWKESNESSSWIFARREKVEVVRRLSFSLSLAVNSIQPSFFCYNMLSCFRRPRSQEASYCHCSLDATRRSRVWSWAKQL